MYSVRPGLLFDRKHQRLHAVRRRTGHLRPDALGPDTERRRELDGLQVPAGSHRLKLRACGVFSHDVGGCVEINR